MSSARWRRRAFLNSAACDLPSAVLSWERNVYDPIPGPRKLSETNNVNALHEFAWLANPQSQTSTGVSFAEAKMAAVIGREVLLVDINGGVTGVVAGLEAAMKELQADLLVGLDVGGDSLAQGHEPGLRSPLADSIMLAALAELAKRGHRTIWGVFGYGSDGELTVDEIELALSKLAAAGGLLGAWSLTPKIAAELEKVIKTVPTEASAIPVQCFRGAWGDHDIRRGQRHVKVDAAHRPDFFHVDRRNFMIPSPDPLKPCARVHLWTKPTTRSTPSASAPNSTTSGNIISA